MRVVYVGLSLQDEYSRCSQPSHDVQDSQYSAALPFHTLPFPLRRLPLHTLFFCSQALAAADAAPAESKGQAALKQLPRCFIMDGVCVYAGKPSKQQLQRAEVNRRTVADASVIGEGGLQSAVLQVTFRSARYGRL